LAIEPTDDESLIRKAYAKKLKKQKQGESVAQFQELREAYQAALAYAVAKKNQASDAEKPSILSEDEGFDRATLEDESDTDVAVKEEDARLVPQSVVEEFHRYIDRLHDKLQSGDQNGATEYFKSILEEPSVVNLNHRPLLEGWLIQLSASLEYFPYEFFDYLAHIFRWKDDIRHIDYRLDEYVRYAFTKYSAYNRFRELRQEGSTGRTARRFAANILTGRFRPLYFWYQRLDKVTEYEIRSLLAELDHSYPTILEEFLDQNTVAWWRNSLQTKSIHWSTLIGTLFLSIISTIPLVESGALGSSLKIFFHGSGWNALSVMLLSWIIVIGSISGKNQLLYIARERRRWLISGIQSNWRFSGLFFAAGLVPAGITSLDWQPFSAVALVLFFLFMIVLFEDSKPVWTILGTVIVFAITIGVTHKFGYTISYKPVLYSIYMMFYLIAQIAVATIMRSKNKQSIL